MENQSSKYIDRFCSNHWIVFIAVICCLWIEFSAAKAISLKSWLPYNCMGANVISYIILALLIGFFISKVWKEGKWFRVDLSRFLTNAIGRKWLSLFFLLIFLMQITWFIDSTFEIVVHGKIEWESLFCLLPLFTMVALNVFFPSVDSPATTPINPEKRTFLVTGFSTVSNNITFNNIDLFLKPFSNLKDGSKYNFQEIVILCSDTLKNAKFDLSEKEEKLWLEEENKWEKKSEERSIIDYLHDYNDPVLEERPEQFKTIIKKIIELKFPSKTEDNSELKIHLSKGVDYDDFNSAYDEVGRMLSIWEKNTDRTVINVSPGTKMVTSALTLHAIKGHRLIFFTEQLTKNVPKSFDVNVFSIPDLVRELIDEFTDEDDRGSKTTASNANS